MRSCTGAVLIFNVTVRLFKDHQYETLKSLTWTGLTHGRHTRSLHAKKFFLRFKALRSLKFMGFYNSGLSPLPCLLKHLVQLDCSRSGVSDLSPLSRLELLEKLD